LCGAGKKEGKEFLWENGSSSEGGAVAIYLGETSAHCGRLPVPNNSKEGGSGLEKAAAKEQRMKRRKVSLLRKKNN